MWSSAVDHWCHLAGANSSGHGLVVTVTTTTTSNEGLGRDLVFEFPSDWANDRTAWICDLLW